jgi:hypothetical protein
MGMIDKVTYTKPEVATDTGAAGALAGLPAQGPISGEQMNQAIKTATADLDSQAAGLEFSQVRDYVAQNKERMSPEALKQFELYEKTALASLKEGKTGIDLDKYNKMTSDMDAALPPKLDNVEFCGTGTPDGVELGHGGPDVFGGPQGNYADQGAGNAIDNLKRGADFREFVQNVTGRGRGDEINGGELKEAIRRGTEDFDNAAAGTEYNDFKNFATENRDKLDPSARRVMDVYDKYARQAQAEGRTGLTPEEHSKMMTEMDEAARPRLSDLFDKIGEKLKAAVDKAGQGGGKAEGAVDDGAGKALGELEGKLNFREAIGKFFGEGKGAKVGGEEFVDTILKGTKDLDGQAAGLEYNDFKNWSNKHADQLSPGAKRAMEVYDKYAREAQANGQTGISQENYGKMETEMREAAKPRFMDHFQDLIDQIKLPKNTNSVDEGAGKAIDDLNQNLAVRNAFDRSGKPVQVDGDQLTNAIEKGTKDLDSQAAGTEYNDFKNWANANRESLSPSAQRVMDVYDKFAREAQANGQTGITQENYDKMLSEMRQAAKPTMEELLSQIPFRR